MEPIEIDGREGEGGGQIVRTSVALAALTGRPLRVLRVRAGRKVPGLQPQHLTAVQAVAQVCGAETEGLRLGAERFRFVPGPIRGGVFRFTVPTAGSAGLVLQAVLPALALAAEPSEVVLEGGTHVAHAPPYDHLEQVFLPALDAMGARARLRLERHGFMPKGGGRMVLEVEPWRASVPFERTARPGAGTRDGPAEPPGWRRTGRVHVARLPEHVTARARAKLEAEGFTPDPDFGADRLGPGPGFAVTLALLSPSGAAVITGLGQKGTPAEVVVARAAEEARAFASSDVPVDAYLADQLLLWLALGAGGRFRTVEPTLHFETQALVVARFLGDRVRWAKCDGRGDVLVEVEGARVVPPGRASLERDGSPHRLDPVPPG